MVLNLITLSTVKKELGLSVTTYDTQITAMIPVVSADVRRILNTNFDRYIGADFSTDADAVTIGDKWAPLFMGQVIYHPNIPLDTYISGYNPITGHYTLSAAPTASGDYVYPTLNIAQWSAVSKMIWYRMGKLCITDTDNKRVSSESYGPVSKTYTESEINARWNYPQILIDDLGTPYSDIG